MYIIENIFDTSIVELEDLIAEVGLNRTSEIWHIHSIDKKSENFVALYDSTAHLCFVSQRWYNNIITNSTLASESTVATVLNENFGALEHDEQIEFSHLESIRKKHVFIKEISQKFTHKQQ
ncbi:hypothetical protein C2G38_2196929 [Gigaspora rosea]|uniref:Uncharacterized protein n=1 Tax=Gigaspora rosea TaxID=44941 RepID=A0A397UYE2_9GLOM|nr:hypothetical protein C2G38_2196929 [Gigaspora rosea]